MAAKRHACDPRAVLDAFRALDEPGGPAAELVARSDEARLTVPETTFFAVGDVMVDVTAVGEGHGARISLTAGGLCGQCGDLGGDRRRRRNGRRPCR